MNEETGTLSELEQKTREFVNGFVEVRLANPKRNGTITIRPFKDKYGNMIGRDGKEYTYVRPVKRLDLSLKEQRDEYELLRLHPFVIGTNPVLKIANFVDDAKKETEKSVKMADAIKLANEMIGETLTDFARILGKNVMGIPESVIKNEIIKTAKNDPVEFMRLYNHPERDRLIWFKKFVNTGVLKQERGLYTYQSEPVGLNQEQVILWMKNNRSTVELMKDLFNNSINIKREKEPSVPETTEETPSKNILGADFSREKAKSILEKIRNANKEESQKYGSKKETKDKETPKMTETVQAENDSEK